MAWMACDRCDGTEYTDENPFVLYRQRRPSDPSDMCCTLAGHKNCIAEGTTLPSISTSGGVATAEQWEEWIESPEAAKAGFCFIS